VKVFEFHHRSRQPLDASMVLFNNIVQVFALADLDAWLIVSIQLLQACLIRTALINVNQTRFSVFIDGFPQKA
jgi:hypothetical protein